MSEKRMNDELAAIEAALGGLTPVASGASRDRLMFLAGQASANTPNRHRRVTTWFSPCAMTASLLAAATFGVLWAAGGKPEIVERVVYVPSQISPATFDFPLAVASPSPPSPWANRRLCQLVLEKGVDAMPQSDIPAARSAPLPPRRDSYRDLMNDLLTQPAI
jgi:hypothetical protein